MYWYIESIYFSFQALNINISSAILILIMQITLAYAVNDRTTVVDSQVVWNRSFNA